MAQTEGVGFYYSENIYGVPPVLIQHVQKFPVLHEVNILITNRAVPVPDVLHQERILVETLGLPGFYHCICRYKTHPVLVHTPLGRLSLTSSFYISARLLQSISWDSLT